MIKLFNINDHVIDTFGYSNLLHDKKVKKLEDKICDYVGAKYACSVNSATNAIFLALYNKKEVIEVPSIIPPVVLNAIIQSGNIINFTDNCEWVGNSYVLYNKNYKIIDSAQKLEKNQFKKEANKNDLMIFSFYPTKPVGSCDGGMIVSNDKNKIEWFREAVLNGTGYAENNWDRITKFPGWKMYMNSIQADIALKNLDLLKEKYEMLEEIKEYYNKHLGFNNTSKHLYRINVKDNQKFVQQAKKNKICCGIHYAACHKNKIYNPTNIHFNCPISEIIEKTTVSIPYHENLMQHQLEYIVKFIKKYENK